MPFGSVSKKTILQAPRSGTRNNCTTSATSPAAPVSGLRRSLRHSFWGDGPVMHPAAGPKGRLPPSRPGLWGFWGGVVDCRTGCTSLPMEQHQRWPSRRFPCWRSQPKLNTVIYRVRARRAKRLSPLLLGGSHVLGLLRLPVPGPFPFACWLFVRATNPFLPCCKQIYSEWRGKFH